MRKIGGVKKLSALVAFLLSLFLLVGCAHSGGTAALVNGQRITEADVTKVVDAIDKHKLNLNPLQLRHDVVSGFIQTKVADQLIKNTGTSPDQAAVEASLARFGELAKDPIIREWLLGPARLAVLSKNVTAATFAEAVDKTKVDLNPRYGVWSPEAVAAIAANRSISEKYAQP